MHAFQYIALAYNEEDCATPTWDGAEIMFETDDLDQAAAWAAERFTDTDRIVHRVRVYDAHSNPDLNRDYAVLLIERDWDAP